MAKVRSQMQKPKYNHPVCFKRNILFHAHRLRITDQLSEGYKEDLKAMVKKSTSLIESMITVCKRQDWLQTALNCIKFGQYITQACWIKDYSLLQLPHFTEKDVKHCEKGKVSHQAKNLQQYLNVPDEIKKGLARMMEEQKEDVFKC